MVLFTRSTNTRNVQETHENRPLTSPSRTPCLVKTPVATFSVQSWYFLGSSHYCVMHRRTTMRPHHTFDPSIANRKLPPFKFESGICICVSRTSALRKQQCGSAARIKYPDAHSFARQEMCCIMADYSDLAESFG